MKLYISCAMGLESVLKFELYDLGFKTLTIQNGGILLDASLNDICKFNLWCRSAGRVFIVIDQFEATSFDDLFDQVTAIDWPKWLPKDAQFPITDVHTKSSDIFSKSDTQRIVKKAIVQSLQTAYKLQQFPETGSIYPIRIRIESNQVTVLLDSSGHGLNKRGYRSRFDAPLRETLAAGILKLSRWNPENDALLDPFCGSGTILIEAAMIANNIAPGINQTFCSESWPILLNNWISERELALAAQKTTDFRIYGSDNNPQILKTARYNIKNSGLSNIFVETKDVTQVRSRFDKGKIICNPPYGIRLEDQGDTHKLYVQMGKQFKQHFSDWHYYILSGDESFETYFNKKATKKRKLFNGKIRCDLYQYF